MESDGSRGRESLAVSGEIIVDRSSLAEVKIPSSASLKVVAQDANSEDNTREWDIPPPPVWGTSSDSMEAPTAPHPRPARPAVVAAAGEELVHGLDFDAPVRRRRGLMLALGLTATAVIAAGALLLAGGDRGASASPPVPAPPARGDDAAPSLASASVPRSCPPGMRHIEGGSFTMGSHDDALRDLAPARRVTVEGFCISEHEVTVEAYRECSKIGECKRAFRDSDWLAASSSAGADEDEESRRKELYSQLCNENYDDRGSHPINCVTWNQARSYCAWKGWHLPSEAQWELAARGPSSRPLPWGAAAPSPEHANVCGSECMQWRVESQLGSVPTAFRGSDAHVGTSPVATFAAGKTPEGLADMAGNVAEWTDDVFALGRGRDGSEGRKRTVRGGSFDSTQPLELHPAFRRGVDEDVHTHDIGFRCVVAPQQSV